MNVVHIKASWKWNKQPAHCGLFVLEESVTGDFSYLFRGYRTTYCQYMSFHCFCYHVRTIEQVFIVLLTLLGMNLSNKGLNLKQTKTNNINL